MLLKSGIPETRQLINKELRVDADDTLQMILRCSIALAKVKASDLVKSCLSCDNFEEQTEVCKKFGNQRPPARIIAFGCPGYDNINEDIPF